MDATSWAQLAVVCFLGAISPGPSLALVINNTMAGGRTYGVLTSLGHATGIGWWALLTAIGVAEFMMDKPAVLLLVQSFGACLLGYIGFRTMNSKGGLAMLKTAARPTSYGILFRGIGEGFIIALFNPKIALFFLAIFSHLVHADSNWIETGFMGITASVIDACWYVFIALMLTGTGLMRVVRGKEATISKVSGALLVGIAFYLLCITFLRVL